MTPGQENRLAERIEIVQALIAIGPLRHEVIDVVYQAPDLRSARSEIASLLGTSERVATHVVDMPLRRLTGRGRSELEEELAEMKAELAR